MSRHQDLSLSLDRHQDLSLSQERHQDLSLSQDRHQDLSLSQDRHQDLSLGQDRHQDLSLGQDRHQDLSLGQDRHQDLSLGQDRHQDLSLSLDRHQDLSLGQGRHQDLFLSKDRHQDLSLSLDRHQDFSLSQDRHQDGAMSQSETGWRRAHLEVPENELRKAVVERVPSEAELRVRRSLQKLNIPEWMKEASTPSQGFLLRRTSSNAQPPWSVAKPWDRGSTSSIADAGGGAVSARLPRYNSTSSAAPSAAASPAPSGAHGGHPLSRWSTSRISGAGDSRPASGTTTPTGSVFSQRSASSFGRSQPYLGWRSQTSLNTDAQDGSKYLSAAERLALSMPHKLLAKSCSADPTQSSSSPPRGAPPQPPLTAAPPPTTQQPLSLSHSLPPAPPPPPEELRPPGCDIHTSIKEVTSAIVHYCTERAPRAPSPRPHTAPRPPSSGGSSADLRRAGSPRPVWVESSFVGSRPLDASPEATELPPLPPALRPRQEGGQLGVH